MTSIDSFAIFASAPTHANENQWYEIVSPIIIGLCETPHRPRLKLKISANLSSANHGRIGRVSSTRNQTKNATAPHAAATKTRTTIVLLRTRSKTKIDKAKTIATGSGQNQSGDKPNKVTTTIHLTASFSSLLAATAWPLNETRRNPQAQTNRAT